MDDYSDLIDQAAQRHNVDPKLISAVIRTESGGNPRAVSPAGAIGLGQLMPATAKAYGVDPTDPAQNIDGTARALSDNLDRFGNVPDALRAYNGGYDPSRWGNHETAAYVGKVAANYGGDAQPTAAPDVSAMDAQWGVSAAPAAQAPTASSPADPGDVAAQDAQWGVGSNDKQPPTPSSAGLGDDATPPATGAAPQGFFDRLGAGIVRGGRDVRDTADAIDAHVPLLNALDATAGAQVTPAVTARDQQQQQAFKQDYGNSLVAGVGRIGGNALATAPLAAITGGVVNPLTAGLADTAASAVAPIAGAAVRLAAPVVAGAAEGAGAGAATSVGQGQDPAQAATTGAEFGGALGGVASAVGRLIPHTVTNAIGGSAPAARAQLGDVAQRQFGIPLTAAQVSGNGPLQRMGQAAETMGGGSEALGQTQHEAFMRGVMRTVGVDANAATQPAMQQARQQISATYDRVLNAAPPVDTNTDPTVLNTLATIDHGLIGVPAQEADAVRNLMDDTVGAAAAHNGQITPQLYQTLIQHGGPLSNAMASENPTIARAASSIKDALDTSFQNGLQASGKGDLAEELTAARFAYKNLKTIEPLVNKSPDGMISPALLQGRVNTQFANRAYQGAGDLGTLADIGQTFLKPPRSSGTPEQGYQLFNAMEGAHAGAALLSGDVPGAAMSLGGMLARPAMARVNNAIANNPALGRAMIARTLGQSTPLNNALAALQTAGPALAQGAVVPTANLLAARQRLAVQQ